MDSKNKHKSNETKKEEDDSSVQVEDNKITIGDDVKLDVFKKEDNISVMEDVRNDISKKQKKDMSGGNKILELREHKEAVASTISRMDENLAIEKGQQMIEKQRLILGNIKRSIDNDIMFRNKWVAISSSDVSVGKIVSVIPYIVKIEKEQNMLIDDNNIRYVNPINQSYKYIDKCTEFFSDNTAMVNVKIESYGTAVDLKYDPLVLPSGGLDLHDFNLDASGQTTSMDNSTRTRALGGLLELIIKMRKAGDVFVVMPEVITIGSVSYEHKTISLLSNKRLPVDMLPHVYIGVADHSLDWFSTYVQKEFDDNNSNGRIVLGETPYQSKRGSGSQKVSSIYGVVTDHIFATLNYLFLDKFDRTKMKASDLREMLNVFTIMGGTNFIAEGEHDSTYDISGIHENQTDQYRFVFLLSSKFRSSCLARLREFCVDINLLSTKNQAEAIDEQVRNPSINHVGTTMAQTILKLIRKLDIESFYDAMVMEIGHHFVRPENAFDINSSSYLDWLLALYVIGYDALVFPNMFWTNIHLKIKALYLSLMYLLPDQTARLLDDGFAEGIPSVRHLSRLDLVSGKIPHLLKNFSLAGKLGSKFMRAIRPRGELMKCRFNGDRIVPQIENERTFYLPWIFHSRAVNDDVPFTDLRAAIMELNDIIIEIFQHHSRKFVSSNTEAGPIKAYLNTLIINRSAPFLSVLHYEGSIVLRYLAELPWMPFYSYKGLPKPNLTYDLGLTSTTDSANTCLPAISENVSYPHGIGFFALISLTGNLGYDSQRREKNSTFNVLIPPPLSMFTKFKNDLDYCVDIAEAFGVASYLLTPHIEKEPAFKFLFEVLGKNLRWGIVSQILDWLLPRTKTDDIKNADENEYADQLDRRLKDPRICFVAPDSRPVDINEVDTPNIMKRMLILLDEVEKKKLRVCFTAVGNKYSKLHNICRGIVVAKKLFDDLRPENVHDEPLVELIFNRVECFSISSLGEKTIPIFRYRGVEYKSVNDRGFPKRLRLVVHNPKSIQPYMWNFINVAMEDAGWQVYFPDMLYVPIFRKITRARAYTVTGKSEYQALCDSPVGKIQIINFFDTTYEVSNPNVSITPGDFWQYICGMGNLQRNKIMNGIYGLMKPAEFKGPHYKDWTFGLESYGSIPSYSNGVPKYEELNINFNNPLRIYAKAAKINEYPNIVYSPPELITI